MLRLHHSDILRIICQSLTFPKFLTLDRPSPSFEAPGPFRRTSPLRFECFLFRRFLQCLVVFPGELLTRLQLARLGVAPSLSAKIPADLEAASRGKRRSLCFSNRPKTAIRPETRDRRRRPRERDSTRRRFSYADRTLEFHDQPRNVPPIGCKLPRVEEESRVAQFLLRRELPSIPLPKS